MVKRCIKCGKILRDFDEVCPYCRTSQTKEKEPMKKEEKPIYPELRCLRCGGKMKFLKKEKISGKEISLLGIFAPSVFVCWYICTECGKYEMFANRIDIVEKKRLFYWGW